MNRKEYQVQARVVNGLSGGQLLITGMLLELVVEVREDEFNNSYTVKLTVRETSLRPFDPPIFGCI